MVAGLMMKWKRHVTRTCMRADDDHESCVSKMFSVRRKADVKFIFMLIANARTVKPRIEAGPRLQAGSRIQLVGYRYGSCIWVFSLLVKQQAITSFRYIPVF